MIGLFEIYGILIGSALVLFGCDTRRKYDAFVRLSREAVRSNACAKCRMQAEGIKTSSGGCCESCRGGSPSGTPLRVPPWSLCENREIWPCPRDEVQAAGRHLSGLSITRHASRL